MQTHQLVSHGAFAPKDIQSVAVRWSALSDGRLMLRYRIDGCRSLVVPEFRGLGRNDGLWQTTCFELFLDDGDGRYREYNFSPSQQWAAYRFAVYRGPPETVDPAAPFEIQSDRGLSIFTLTAFLSQTELAGARAAGLTAVLEEEGGRLSYWALSHAGAMPDFHDPAGFRIPLGEAA